MSTISVSSRISFQERSAVSTGTFNCRPSLDQLGHDFGEVDCTDGRRQRRHHAIGAWLGSKEGKKR